jgi:hypothetical protein
MGQLARGFAVDNEQVMRQISSNVQAPTSTPVHLLPVSTFIQDAKGDPIIYVVPPFARHWGVVVGQQNRFLFHLVFRDVVDVPSDTKPDSLTGRVRAVEFVSNSWDPTWSTSSIREVGNTPYSIDKILGIGMTLRLSLLTSRERNDKSIRRLSSRLLELSNLRGMFAESHM